MCQHAGWLVAAAAVCALFAGSALSGPTSPAAINGCVYNASPGALTDKQVSVFQCDIDRNLKVSGSFSAGSITGAVTTSTATTGGDSTFSAPGGTGTALITNTAGGILVATGAHSLKGWSFWNTGNATCYIQVFNLAAGTATLGTTVPKMVVPVPTNGTMGGWEEKFPEGGVAFSLGIVIAATTTTTGSSACNAAQQATVVYK